MTVINFLTIIYLWLTFTALANGQYPNVPRNFYPPQIQPPTNPLTDGRQNSFVPGPQLPGFNSNHQATNPQNFPRINNPQNFPPVSSPQNFPRVNNPQNFPPVNSPQNFPRVNNPQNFPPVNNPQNFPRVNNPQNFPQGNSPHNFPQITNPQNIPQRINPQNFPQIVNPRNIPQRINPQNFPQIVNPRSIPQVTNPQTFPQRVNLQNFPQIINPRNIPQVNNLRNIPQATNPQNNPQASNPQHFPQMNNYRNIPQVNNPRNIPQVINPQNIPQTTNPQNNAQVINSQSAPRVSHFGSSPIPSFNLDQLIKSLFPQGSPFHRRPVNPQSSFNPQNTASHYPAFVSQPSSSFMNPQQTNHFHPGTQSPIFTNPPKIDRDFNNPQQTSNFNPQPTASQISTVPQLIPPISDSNQTNRDSTVPAPTNADSPVPEPTNSDSTVFVPTNSDSAASAPTNSDSEASVPSNSDSTVPAPTNSVSTVSMQTNLDTTIPVPIKSNSTIPVLTNSDTTVTQQDDSLSTVPQLITSTSTSPQNASTKLEDAQPIASASETSSSVSIVPQDNGYSGHVPHNRSTKYRFHFGKQTNPESQEDPLRGLRIVCLFNNKHYMTSGFTPANIDPHLCTHLNYEFAVLDPTTYEMIIGEPDFDVEQKFYEEAIALKQINPKLKVLLSLGGWTDSTKKYSELADDPAKRKNFVLKAVDFLTKHGFDGLDLAWEYPNCWQGALGVSPKDKQNFVSLLREIKQEFQNHGLLLSVSVGAIKREVEAAYDVPGVSRYVDYINVMTYDMHGPWESKTSHHVQFEAMPGDEDPYCNVKGGMQVWIEKGANKKKLNLGIAFYARTFTMQRSDVCQMGVPAKGIGKPGETTKKGGFLNYNEICKYLNSGKWIEKQDRHAGFYACSGDQWAGYDPPMMIVRKVKYVVEYELGGVLLKDLSGDDFKGECFSFSMPFPLLRMVKMEMEHKVKQKYLIQK